MSPQKAKQRTNNKKIFLFVMILINIICVCLAIFYHRTTAELHHGVFNRGELAQLAPDKVPVPDVRRPDYFKSMTQLFAHTKEGRDWKKEVIHTKSDAIIIAPHGGNIEKGTTELSRLVARKNHYNFYSFIALRHHAERLHVTSAHYNDPQLLKMLQKQEYAVAIHGAKGNHPIVYIGGLDTPLKLAIQKQLIKSHFVVKPAPTYLGGELTGNFVNKDLKHAGVQLELTTALRKSFFVNDNFNHIAKDKHQDFTKRMYVFADAIDRAIDEIEHKKSTSDSD